MSDGENKKELSIGSLLKAFKGKNPESVAKRIVATGELESLWRRRIAAQEIPSWTILRYQRILDPFEIPLPLLPFSYTSPKVFEDHLRYIKKNLNPMPLGELVLKIYRKEEIPEKTVALTFEYGHADFFLNAYSLLSRYEIPATVCLVTGYIDTRTFLPIDRMCLGLTALKEFGRTIPRFEYFDDAFYKHIESCYVDGKITPRAVLAFLDGFRALTEFERSQLFKAFASALGEDVPFPEYEDFLRWEDVKRLSDHGVTFTTMGHGGVVASQCPTTIFRGDIVTALDRMVHYEIPREKYFCLAQGAFNQSALATLAELKFRVALSIGDMPPIDQQSSDVIVLGRTMMSQELAATEARFACRVARVVAEGITF